MRWINRFTFNSLESVAIFVALFFMAAIPAFAYILQLSRKDAGSIGAAAELVVFRPGYNEL